jgi:hypothetical protein
VKLAKKLRVFVCQQCEKFSIVPFGPQVTTLELEARLLLYTKLIPPLNSTEVPGHVSVVLIFLTICPCFGFSRKNPNLDAYFKHSLLK